MKKWAGLLLICCLLLACACGLAEDTAPAVAFAAKSGKINCGMDYTVTVKAAAPFSSDTIVFLQCSALNATYQAAIPAGQDTGSVTITIPEESRGQRLDFVMQSGEGYAPTKEKFALQVYSMPKVIFYSPYMMNHLGKEAAVRVVCQNPNSVVAGNNTFELRNLKGEVLDTITWSNPSKDASFKFDVTPELLGKQNLSVWLNGTCVTAEEGYLFLSDTSVKRLSTMDPSEPAMSITIDCGSPSIKTPQQTKDVLAVLEKYGVKATFFMTGSFVETQTESARMILEAGHEIANHTATHPRMTQVDYRTMHREVMRCTKLIEDLLGVSPRLFRPPYGDTNEKVTCLVRAEGMEEVMWTIDSYDWHAEFTQSRIIERVTNEKTLVNGSIILFHINGLKCAENLDQVIPYYQNVKGFKCVPVTELMALSGRELPPMPADREALVYTPSAQ